MRGAGREHVRWVLTCRAPRAQVAAKVLGPTPLGYNVMVNGDQEGLIYHSEVFDDQPLTPGALLEAWVLKVRDDGKVDVSLRQPAVQQVAPPACRTVGAARSVRACW